MSIVADLASAAAVAAIPLLHATVGLELWELLLLVFLGALLDAPGATARVSLFPDLVERAGVRISSGAVGSSEPSSSRCWSRTSSTRRFRSSCRCSPRKPSGAPPTSD